MKKDVPVIVFGMVCSLFLILAFYSRNNENVIKTSDGVIYTQADLDYAADKISMLKKENKILKCQIRLVQEDKASKLYTCLEN